MVVDARYVYKFKHKILGLCWYCPNKAEEGKTRCSKCASKDREYINNVKKKRTQEGKCPKCGYKLNPEIDGNKKHCYLCCNSIQTRREDKFISERMKSAIEFIGKDNYVL